MKYVVLFPNTDKTLKSSVCVASSNIEANSPYEASQACAPNIPMGWPVVVYPSNEYDIKFHDAYTPDWKNEKINVGSSERMRTAFLAMGYEENW